MRTPTALLLLALLAAPTPSVRAALPDEIQVYTDDINAPGERGLELHLNTTPRGNPVPGYPGERITEHGWRITPEWSWGLTRTVELGLYLPIVLNARGNGTLAGIKPRLKWLPIRPEDGAAGWFAGVNFELSRVKREFDEAQSALEMRNIIGRRGEQWSFSVNPFFRWSLAPGYRGAPEFALGLRGMRHLSASLRAGVEYYSDVGPANAFVSRSQQARTLFGVVEVDLPRDWSLHLGIGHGSGSADPWTVKGIISFPH